MSKFRNQISIKSLDLFCGIGGLTLGLKDAGFTSIGGIDIWPDALQTFELNLGLRGFHSDLRNTSVAEIEKHFRISANTIDVLVGGPPCQGFSTVGKRDKSDPRNTLWSHFLKLVDEIKPFYVLIENVEGLQVMEAGGIRQEIINQFAQIGYCMKSKILHACDYGVPQLRKRIFFLGWLEGVVEPEFPEPSSIIPVTVRDAIFDLPNLGPGEKATEYTSEPFTEYQRARRGQQSLLFNHEAANHSAELVKVLSYIPDGGNRKSIPEALQPKSGFHNSYARLASDKPAIAVTSNMRKPSSARATHPTQNRGLTVREGLRLQSFNDSFLVHGSRTSQYLQVGNAVPPLLAKQVGQQLHDAFVSNSSSQLSKARKKSASQSWYL